MACETAALAPTAAIVRVVNKVANIVLYMCRQTVYLVTVVESEGLRGSEGDKGDFSKERFVRMAPFFIVHLGDPREILCYHWPRLLFGCSALYTV